MSTKFDDPQYLADWKNTHKYPQIHDKMTYAASFMKGGNLLDLCCSYGLLGARLGHTYPEKFPYVVGIDGDPKVIKASHAAGMVDGPQAELDALEYMMVTPATLGDFTERLRFHEITSIVARRAFPELFSEEMGSGHEFGKQVSSLLHSLGVKEILIEGRVYSARSTNTLAHIDNEIALFSEYYTAKTFMGVPNVALLEAK